MLGSLRSLFSIGAFGIFLHHGALPQRRASQWGVRLSCSGNEWRDDPEKALARALQRNNAEWTGLQASIAAANEGDKDPRLWEERAADLLASGALDRLRPHLPPAEDIDIPPLRGSDAALEQLISSDALALVDNFHSGAKALSAAGQAFWQAELYLRSMHQEAGEDSVQGAAEDAKETMEAEPAAFQATLRNSVLLGRQNFVTSARFGYFLARGTQRLALERRLRGEPDVKPSDNDDFLSKLVQQANMGTSKPQYNALDRYLSDMSPEGGVEIARAATQEAARALQLRADQLFGKEQDLLDCLDKGLDQVAQMQLGTESRRLLNMEAAAFGAALFEAETAAARNFELSYTSYGSRQESPLR